MRAPEDVPIHHLVVDSGGFVKCASLIDIGSKIYSIASVIDEEVKDKKTKQRILAFPFDIIVREPSSESVRAVIQVSKKTGDYASLSVTDLKVLALTHDLHVEHCGRDGIVYDVEIKPPVLKDKSKNKKVVEKPEPSKSEKVAEEMTAEMKKEEKEDEWIDETNIDDVVLRSEMAVGLKPLKMEVACLTTDFALQNVLLHMKLNISSVNGMRITRLKTFILRCRVCKKTTSDVAKKFCPNCGHQSLHKVGVSVDKNGNQIIHINWERERVKRGYVYSLPTPKGGKHSNDIRVTEDHMMPQNRMAKVITDPLCDAPFSLTDVTSRSALLGIRKYGREMPRNPNEWQKGKKSKGKRH
jgi:RNA-binding protein NOB1|uniref:RNA-binding protein NOB1 n=1 Tax=Panagrolaimus sp. PS1159 TaxID=55785 RepID=A0AC35G034_9BILA